MNSDQYLHSEEKHLENDDKTIESSKSSDINQNFINNEKTNTRQTLPQFRGLNNLKPSPDSGWTFPSLANSPMIPHGVSPQSYSNFLPENTNNLAVATTTMKTGNLHLPLKNATDVAYNNSFSLMDPYQTRLSPLVDMNFHQQQMLKQHYFQQHMQQVHNRNKQLFTNALTPSGFHPNNIYTPSGLHPIAIDRNNESFMKKNNDNHVRKVNTLGDDKDQTGNCLPSFFSLTSAVRVKQSPDLHVGAQKNQFVSLFQKNHMRLPLVNPNTEQDIEGELVHQKETNLADNTVESSSNKSNANTPISLENNNRALSAAVHNKPKRPTLLGKIFIILNRPLCQKIYIFLILVV